MAFDLNFFGTRVRRADAGTLKEAETPAAVREAGLVSYWGAEFEFPTCPAFSRGVVECAQRGLYAFTVQNEVYNARVAWWLEAMRGWAVQPDWIVPTHGTIFALSTAIRLFVHSGERMVVLTPGYNRYAQAASRNGLATVAVPLRETVAGGVLRYELDFDALEAVLSDEKNTLLVLCNPNNPTGTVFGAEALRRLDALARRTNTAVFCDEIFAEVALTGDVVPYGKIAAADSLALTCTSLGKCMSLTGVNHANVLIPNDALRARYIAQKYADHYGSLDPMLYAGLCSACSSEGREFVLALRTVIRENAAAMSDALRAALPGITLTQPDGTFVLWVNYEPLGLSDAELARFLHEEALFYGDVGTDYGVGGQYYRYNLAVPPQELRRSMEYLRRAAARRGFCKEEPA